MFPKEADYFLLESTHCQKKAYPIWRVGSLPFKTLAFPFRAEGGGGGRKESVCVCVCVYVCVCVCVGRVRVFEGVGEVGAATKVLKIHLII